MFYPFCVNFSIGYTKCFFMKLPVPTAISLPYFYPLTQESNTGSMGVPPG